MNLTAFLDKIKTAPETIEFNDTITVIDANYDFTPTSFKNGNTFNEAGKNSGSCKLFSFAQLNKLSTAQTLQCFGSFYRKDVLQNRMQQTIKTSEIFMVTGWEGITFEGNALKLK